MYTTEHVQQALAAYASRPHTAKGRPADLEANGPRLFAGLRNMELVAEPHINAPVRGLQIFRLTEPPNQDVLPALLPILAEAARNPGPTPPAAPARRFPGNADEVLDRLASNTITDDEILAWMRSVAYHIEAFANSRHASTIVPLDDERLHPVREQIRRGLAAAMRPIAHNALLKLLADGHPG